MRSKSFTRFIFINIFIFSIGINVVKTQTHQDDKSSILSRAYDLIFTNPKEAVKLGANDYLTKPYDIEELLNCINRALAR